MKLLIADDHPIVLEGLEALLRRAGHAIVGRCRSGEEVIEALAAARPDIIVLDVNMPGMGGLELLRRLKCNGLAIRVVLLSSSLNDAQVIEAVRLGVDGLVLKETAADELIACLGAVAEGRQWLDAAAARRALNAAAMPAAADHAAATLTPREAEIVRHISRGRPNKQIARDLAITEGTVKMHLHRIYEKLDVKNRTELSAVARDRGLI